MKIKFLSFIASFFMVSFVITSCLDDDNNIEYSPDATIHAFELDTIGGYGVKYKFTIDQLSREIYNEDSLPVHADTIIDKTLIKTLTTVSGVVTMKDKSGNDSVLNINDSIDLREPLTIKVWSTEALAGISPNQTKEYTIKVNVHQHDPDSLGWKYCGNIDEANLTEEQKSVTLGNNILTYSVVGGNLMVYRAQIGNTMHWTSNAVNDDNKFNNQLPSSILSYKERIYSTSATKDGKVYESADGITWTESSLFNDNVNLLLAPLSNKITYIRTVDGKKFFDSTNEIASIAETNDNLQEVPEDFPIGNISYTTYTTATNQEAITLIGEYKEQPTVGETKTIVPWGYMEDIWIDLPPNNVDTSCPAFTNPSIIYYNDQFYIFGEKFESFYVSPGGIAWRKANKKFYLPSQDWSESGFTPSTEKPEFRGRKAYSALVNKDDKSIYILFSAGSASVDESHSYSYKSEVWRGRLNQLWFDLDPEHAGQ